MRNRPGGRPNGQFTMPRRDFLGRTAMAFSAASIAAVPGCDRQQKNPEPEQAAVRTSPLRISFLGPADDMGSIRRAWSAVSDQPLEFAAEKFDRSRVMDTALFLDSARRADVIIYPFALVGEAVANQTVIEFSDTDLDSIQQTAGPLLVGLRNATRFAGQVNAIPLGATQPAVLSTSGSPPLPNWNAYDQWVDDELSGKAAEPLAPGWAAAMFLWRVASTKPGTWLFGRENLSPVIADEPYVESLRLMKRTADRYTEKRLAPSEIWRGLAGGELSGGIGFEYRQPIDGLAIGNLPGEDRESRILIDMFTPVVSVSSGCRQSSAAKQLVAWLAGGDGSESLRRQIPSMTVTRSQGQRLTQGASLGADSNAGPMDSGPSLSAQKSDYDTWLVQRLDTTMTLPSPQLLSATQYYYTLDQQVGRCLDGEIAPAAALKEAADSWQNISQSVGIEAQIRQWRRCQGMRA